MDIISKSVPRFDENNIERSMQEFRNYMVQTLEQIDYTLSLQRTTIRGAVSEENFNALAQEVAALSSSLVDLKSTVSQHTSKIQDLEESISGFEKRFEDIEKRIEALEQK